MSDSQKQLQIAGIISSVVICILLVFGGIFLFAKGLDIPNKISMLMQMVALLLGLVYSISGYSKKSADFYKGFMLSCAISCIITVICLFIASQYDNSTIFSIITLTINSVALLLLAFGKDMGEKKSIIITLVLFIICFARFVIVLATYNTDMDKIFAVCVDALQVLIMSTICFEFVIAKYVDKRSRNTK